ncbi:oligosaccharide flippase family protein [Nonomuraea turcica]|uniref:oligosaccharide flippase family protein n=1 Tax=Nonomuraea sp. G32 TaxID=3067274 RepID=UPI00273AC8BB|nr:oligosaccharide flippase family protein [Nonomuraea sp. G32]MDP4500823.1 oligosaccharide flippase family protein [Nonomuraea sp. G32]
MAEQPGPDISDIGRKAGRGAVWSLLGTLVTRAGSFILGLVLARLLAPADFGIYAVALAATQFVMVVKDAGVMSAVLQWRGRLEDIAPTATTLTMFSAVGLYAVFWVGAPYFSMLAGSEEATSVVRILTAVILVEAITAVRSAALLRWFRTGKNAKAVLAGFLVNAPVAIVLAIGGAGAYSFAWGQLVGAVVTGVFMLIYARLPYRLGFDRQIAAKLLRFGIPSAAGIALEVLLLNVGYIIVGNIMGKDWLGFYLMAFNVSSWVPGMIGSAIRMVSIAGFSRLAERDEESLSLGVQRTVPLLITTVLPLAAFMAVLAHPLIIFIYGAKWELAAGVLRFLAVLMVVRMLTSFALDILNGQGATRSTVWMNLGHAAAMIPAVIIGTHLDGIRGAAIGQAAAAVLVALPLAMLAVQRAGVRLAPVLPALVRPAAGAVVCAAVMLGLSMLTQESPLIQLIVAGGGGLLAYALLVVTRDQFHFVSDRLVRLLPARAR